VAYQEANVASRGAAEKVHARTVGAAGKPRPVLVVVRPAIVMVVAAIAARVRVDAARSVKIAHPACRTTPVGMSGNCNSDGDD
jgi:hypothetical protein